MNHQPDTSPSTHPDHLFTWLDVNQYFADLARQKAWPTWLREVDAYWDGVRLAVDPGMPAEPVWVWLRSVLGPLTVEPDRSLILLDDAGNERPLPVEIDSFDQAPPADRRPRWGDRRIVAELGEPLPAPRPSLPHEVSIIAFHSFKGGVGRTLHCVAAARRLVEEGRRVLLVDADLEAPGITWMASEVTRIDFAYEDFLALVHGAMDEKYIDAVRLGQKFLTNQTLDGVVVMPARRDHTRVTPSPIEPIDLLTSERDPYVLTEALAELGHALQVDAVLIDLRAGASELSAPLLLDPRVHRVFVTTISDQSVRGTAQILRDLALRAPATRATDPDCALLLTQFSDQDHSERLLEVAAELRSAALAVSRRSDEAAISNQDTTDSDVAIAVMTSPFDSRLLNLPASWNSVVTLTARAGLSQVLTPLIEAMPGQPTQVATLVAAATPGTIDDTRNRLARVAADLVFADSSEEADFLATEALRNLAEAHRTELPIEIVIGSKGAGKTFTYLQLCRRPDWSSFIDATGIRASSLQVPTVPVLASSNLADPALINERRAAAAHRLTGQEPANSQAIRDMVTEALALELTPVGWRRVWLACFARAIGIPATSETAEDELTSFARRQSAIFVLDGLEDLFQEFVESQHEQRALRALLVECPEWLRTLRGRPLGMVAFVRRDLAQAALRQNFAQFEKRYEKYSLRWNREEALRLAAWVCQRGGALDVANNEVRSASEDHLSELMLAAWGEKMGTLKSKEARSEVWFFAALSDFRQQVQARDIVSFLATAADESVGSDSRWSDRVLTPTAMRNALPVCSQQKIEAIRLENRPVGVLLDRLQALDIEQKKLPFQLDAVGLDSEQAQLLDANGVLFREDNQYWIPEIFRHGLGFTVPGGRRPRVIAVANLVRRRNNLAG